MFLAAFRAFPSHERCGRFAPAYRDVCQVLARGSSGRRLRVGVWAAQEGSYKTDWPGVALIRLARAPGYVMG